MLKKCPCCGAKPLVSVSGGMLRMLCQQCNAKLVGPVPTDAAGPQFDVMEPEQERLAIEFTAEINAAGSTDPVRLLEIAEALYKAEMGTVPLALALVPCSEKDSKNA